MSPTTSRQLSRLALALLLAACVQPAALLSQAVQRTRPGVLAALPSAVSITGVVSGEGEGAPVSGASVRALQSGAVRASATTGADGTYTLAGLPAGSYDLSVEAAGFRPQLRFGLVVVEAQATTSDFTLEAVGVRYVYDAQGRLAAVINPSGEAALYSYDEAGNIRSVSRRDANAAAVLGFTPSRGTAGTAVNVYGTGFGEGAGQNSVSFNGLAAQVLAASTNQLTVVAPPGVETGPISVTTPAGSATSAAPFVVEEGGPVIEGFEPAVGPAGTTVRLAGRNFDPGGLNNRVSFNVTRSTVSAATANSIDTTVPPVTGSGRLGVTTPFGTAKSTQDFFFTPSPFTAADVELTGRLSVGATRQVQISTPGKLAIFVFEGVAGRRVSLNLTNINFNVSTLTFYKPDGTTLANGSVVGTSELVGPYTLPVDGTYTILIRARSNSSGSLTLTLHDVPPDASAAITPGRPGTPVNVNVTTPGQDARLTFAGTAGQKVAVRLSNNTVGQMRAALLRPDGSTLENFFADDSSFKLGVATLPAQGAYTILVDPDEALTGGVTVTLNDVSDLVEAVTPGGPPAGFNFLVPDQVARLTFDAAAGQRVGIRLTNHTINQTFVDIVSGGTTISRRSALSGDQFLDPVTLPSAGAYAVVIDPLLEFIGGVTVTLYDVPADIAGAVTPGQPGTPVNVSLTTPGQNARLTFNGTANQKVQVRVNGNTVGMVQVSLRRPDGSSITSFTSSDAGFSLLPRVLPGDGAYSVLVDPAGANTGGLSVTLNDATDIAGTITPGGPPVPVANVVPEQDVRLTFEATAGQRVSVRMSNVTVPLAIVRLVGPSGSSLGSDTLSPTTGGFIDTRTLATAGTYALEFDPTSENVGGLTLTLYDVPLDITGTLTPGGAASVVNITTPGHNARLTFAGVAVQQVTVRVTNSTVGFMTVRLLRPDGTALTSSSSVSANFNLLTQTLPADGTYTVLIDPNGANTGGLNVRVTSP